MKTENPSRTGARKYKGYEIRSWSGPYGSHPDGREPRYFVQTQHQPSGIDWSAENCPKFWSLKAAKEWINDRSSGK